MKKQLRRCGLMVLAMVPIASVAFAAKAALNIAQINKPGVPNADLAGSPFDSKN